MQTKKEASELTAAELHAKIQYDISKERVGILRHNDIIGVLEPHNGKTITRRLNKVLEPIGAQLAFKYGMIYVSFRKEYNEESHEHLLAYDNNPVVNTANFHTNTDCCCGDAAVKRNEQREKELNHVNAMVAALNEFKEAVNVFSAATKGNGHVAYYIEQAAKAKLQDAFLWRIS